jgi:transcriptional regulator with XRE-family HTH domain
VCQRLVTHAFGSGSLYRAVADRQQVLPQKGCVAGGSSLPRDTTSADNTLEEALRILSRPAFNAVVRSGVRDFQSLLTLDPFSLPQVSRKVKLEIQKLQAGFAALDDGNGMSQPAEEQSRPWVQVAPRDVLEPATPVRTPADAKSKGRTPARIAPAPDSIPPWSVLKATLLDLFHLDDKTRDLTWATADGSKLSNLSLSDGDWARLRASGLFPEDPCCCLLAMTVEYLLTLAAGETLLDAIANFACDLLRGCGSDADIDVRTASGNKEVVTATEIVDLRKLRLDSFDIPQDIAARMRYTGIFTWEALAGISERAIVEKSGAGLGGLRRVRDLWWLKAFAPTAVGIVSPLHIGTSDGFSALVRTLMGVAWRRPNDITVFQGRFGLLEGRLWTLQELADLLGLSRERIRQIEKKMRTRLQAPPNRAPLDAFGLVVSQVLRTAGGVCTYEEVGRALCDILRWDNAPPVPVLERFLDSLSICGCDRARDLAFDSLHKCVHCRVARTKLESLLGSQDASTPIVVLADGLTEACEAVPGCQEQTGMTRFSHGYVVRLLSDNRNYVIDNDVVYSRDQWRLRNGSRVRLVESILRDAGRPMHFGEVCEKLKELLPNDQRITPHNVHRILRGAESILWWGSGTFVYAEAVTIPRAVLEQIESWLIDRLDGGAPFVMVSGAFADFRRQCVAAGVGSESALYTCLRQSGNVRLVYPRYPQIYLADSYESRIPAMVALEQYILSAGREVPLAELTEYALGDLCLKEFQFQQCIARFSGVVRTGDGGFLDMSLLPIDQNRLNRLKDDILKMMDRDGHIAVTRVYGDKRVTCRMMGITSAEMLYSVLRECDFHELEVRTYPQISLANRRRKPGEGRGVTTDVVSFIRQKSAPISFEELEERFVEDLGYREQTVHAAVLVHGVLRYGQGSVVHLGALAWSDQKQTLLERAAFSELERNLTRGWVHGLASDLLEGRDLPDIGGRIPWTKTLLSELLILDRRFRLLGSTHNAFLAIPNKDGIENLGDLVARELRLQFGGAASLEQMQNRLRELGIIERRLTPTMLGAAPDAVVDGNLVLLRELAKCAE